MKRRDFLTQSFAAGAFISLPLSLSAFNLNGKNKTVSIGVVADVHQDIIHDGPSRLQFFIDDMKKRNPNFIIQLGDFALPRKRNQSFLNIWNTFQGSKYHVLGNHDMRDLGFTREQTMAWWQMEKRYYSFDNGGLHFIVLDGNDKNPKPWTGYDRYIGEEQQTWLKKDLKETKKPTIVFCHQSLESKGGIHNREAIRTILENAKISSHQSKVIACFSGHHHVDYIKKINTIPYIQINSMSYKWVGSKYQHQRFAPHIEHTFPNLKNTCPYRTPLYTMLTINTETGTLHIEGRETQFIPPTPHDLNMPNADSMRPTITENNLNISI